MSTTDLARGVSSLAALSFLLVAGAARAEPTTADRDRAEQLFQQARSLMAEGRVHEACPKLEEAKRLDGGGGTLLALALCHEQDGRGATALGELREARAVAVRAGRSERVDLADQHIRNLEINVSRVTVITSQAEVGGMEVRLDDVVLERAKWNVGLPVDAGTHVVSASAPGKTRWESKVSVNSTGDVRRIEIPAWPATTSTEGPAPRLDAPRSTADASSGSNGKRTAGLIVGGIGLAGLAVGTVFGIRAIQKRDEALDVCGGSTACTNPAGVALDEESKDAALIATLGFGAGVACVGASVFLLLTAKADPPKQSATSKAARTRQVPRSIVVAPAFAPSMAGLGLSGTF